MAAMIHEGIILNLGEIIEWAEGMVGYVTLRSKFAKLGLIVDEKMITGTGPVTLQLINGNKEPCQLEAGEDYFQLVVLEGGLYHEMVPSLNQKAIITCEGKLVPVNQSTFKVNISNMTTWDKLFAPQEHRKGKIGLMMIMSPGLICKLWSPSEKWAVLGGGIVDCDYMEPVWVHIMYLGTEPTVWDMELRVTFVVAPSGVTSFNANRLLCTKEIARSTNTTVQKLLSSSDIDVSITLDDGLSTKGRILLEKISTPPRGNYDSWKDLFAAWKDKTHPGMSVEQKDCGWVNMVDRILPNKRIQLGFDEGGVLTQAAKDTELPLDLANVDVVVRMLVPLARLLGFSDQVSHHFLEITASKRLVRGQTIVEDGLYGENIIDSSMGVSGIKLICEQARSKVIQYNDEKM